MSCLILGIVNVTPDSFSDGGQFHGDGAVEHALDLIAAGADWIDIGGESTRPGALSVGADEELARVIPVITDILRRMGDARISIDTSKASVAAAAIAAGAKMVNDVTALGDSDMASVVARADVELVLMHMRGEPRTMQANTGYSDLVSEVVQHLTERRDQAIAAGVAPNRIVLDPGVGFGKAAQDNPSLIWAGVPALRELGHRVLIGASRKRFIGGLTGVDRAADRVAGSIGAALAAAEAGASMVRVHDVAATRHALDVFESCRGRR